MATNVGRADGYAGFLAGEIQVGDAVVGLQQTDGIFADGAGTVTAVNAGAKTITFSGYPSRTQTGKALGFFVRRPPANLPPVE